MIKKWIDKAFRKMGYVPISWCKPVVYDPAQAVSNRIVRIGAVAYNEMHGIVISRERHDAYMLHKRELAKQQLREKIDEYIEVYDDGSIIRLYLTVVAPRKEVRNEIHDRIRRSGAGFHESDH